MDDHREDLVVLDEELFEEISGGFGARIDDNGRDNAAGTDQGTGVDPNG